MVLWDNNLAPFSSDKIRAKILDLGYGGARTAVPQGYAPPYKSSQARIPQSHLKRRPRELCSDLAHTQGGHAWEPRLSLSRYLSNINGR